MKIYNIKDIEGFFNVISDCVGNVFLTTSEGDKLNLKSNLCKYIALANVFTNPDAGVPEMELVAEDPADIAKLTNFLVKG